LPRSRPADGEGHWHFATLSSRRREGHWHFAMLGSRRPRTSLALCHALVPPTGRLTGILPMQGLADPDGRWHFAKLGSR